MRHLFLRRLAILWLTLLGAFWFTRAVVSAVLFQRADEGTSALLLLAVVPLAQALAIAWLTRDPGPPDPPPAEIFDPAEGVGADGPRLDPPT